MENQVFRDSELLERPRSRPFARRTPEHPRRIRSLLGMRFGRLSSDDTCKLICRFVGDGLSVTFCGLLRWNCSCPTLPLQFVASIAQSCCRHRSTCEQCAEQSVCWPANMTHGNTGLLCANWHTVRPGECFVRCSGRRTAPYLMGGGSTVTIAHYNDNNGGAGPILCNFLQFHNN